MATVTISPHPLSAQSFLLTRVQPALSGLMDGALSTLAPIFAVALATHRPLTAFFTGAATALGAGVSMAFSEGLSGELVILAWLRHRFFRTSFTRSFLAITVGGAIIAALSAALGIAAGG
jgi:erythrin-vacuolar iron transport family protein